MDFFYKTDQIKLICGNSLEILPQLDIDFSLVFTDPPYNVGKNYEVYKDDLPMDVYEANMKKVIEESRRVSNNQLAFYVGSKRSRLFWNLMPDARCIIIRKGAISTPNKSMYYRQWSSLLTTKKPNRRIYDIWSDIRQPGEGYYFRETRYPHPGLTCESLIARIIRFFTEEGDLVLDPFVGTGTTAVICKKLNRRCIGIELNPNYLEIAVNRLSKEDITLFESRPEQLELKE